MKTHDKGESFYAVEKVGKTRFKTPEGFLVCTDVKIARTGDMYYGEGESPIEVNENGFATIHRSADEVFRPETIASFNGKPLLIQHPDGVVDPSNWKQLVVGTVYNPRRGEGADSNFLVADVLIMDLNAINAVERDLIKELSCGYDANYVEVPGKPHEGEQTNIVGNHVALVESGRCGPRCAIGDHSHKPANQELDKVSKKKLDKTWLDGLLARAFKAKDMSEVEKLGAEQGNMLDEAGEGGGHEIHLHMPGAKTPTLEGGNPTGANTGDDATEARFARLEAMVEKLCATRGEGDPIGDSADPDGDDEEVMDAVEAEAGDVPGVSKDKVRKAKDSALLSVAFRKTVANAEIISPGIKVPAFDSKAKPKATVDAACGLRRSTLDTAMSKEPTIAKFVAELTGSKTLAADADCSAVRIVFDAVAGFCRDRNAQCVKTGDAGAADDGSFRDPNAGPGEQITLAEINKRNREKYKPAVAA